MLDKMLKRDLKELDSWITPLKESLYEWRAFSEKFRGPLRKAFLEGQLEDQVGRAAERQAQSHPHAKPCIEAP